MLRSHKFSFIVGIREKTAQGKKNGPVNYIIKTFIANLKISLMSLYRFMDLKDG